jgi:hypothetical protein
MTQVAPLPAIDWKLVPKQALVDALRNTSIGPSNLSRQDKSDLVDLAKVALRSDRASLFQAHLDEEIAYQRQRRLP